MLRGAVAGRYAEALYEIAKDKVDVIESELKAIEVIFGENPDLLKLLYHPQVTADAKKDLLEKLFKGKVSDITGNFLALLVDRRREAFFGDIVAEFVRLANAGRNIVEARVASAVELNDKEKAELNQVMVKLTGKKIKADYTVDPSLVGGIVVRIGDKIIDGSIRARLATLRDRLKATS